MKKYTKASMEVVEIKNTDIVTDSGENTEEPSGPNPPGIDFGHGLGGNQPAC